MKFIFDGKELITDPNFDVLLQRLAAFLQVQTDFLLLQKNTTEDILAQIPNEVQQPEPPRPVTRNQIPKNSGVDIQGYNQQNLGLYPPRPRKGTPLLNPFAETGQISYVTEEDPGYGDPGIEYKGGY